MRRSLGLLCCAALVLAACGSEPGAAEDTGSGADQALGPSADEPATVVRVIDGDTFEALLGGRSVTVRLFGVDTPERGEACSLEATDRTRMLLRPGDRVRLQRGPRNDDGRRLLRYTFTASGALLDALLVEEGLGEAWRRDGQLRDAIVELEAEARAAGSGCLWGER